MTPMRGYRTPVAGVVALAALMAGGALMQRAAAAQEAEAFDRAQLRRVERIIAERYVEVVDTDDLYQMAIDGMLDRLGDPHSTFIDAADAIDLEITTTGNYGGLGIRVQMVGEWVTVMSVIAGTPAEREGLLTGPLPITALPEVHATLSANRAAKGLAMSMSLPDLQTMAGRFPEAMSLFGCRDAERLIAAALCLRLSADVLYVFYWGDLPGHETFSPVVPLAAAIYGHCQQAGIRLLDVGASTLDVVPNFGLLQFKRGLGFTESLKLRMQKEL